MDTALERSLLSTAAYGLLFDYPFTTKELWSLLWRPPTGSNFSGFADALLLDPPRGLVSRDGYWYFFGKEDSVKKRHLRLRCVEDKMVHARRGARILRFLPWVMAVFVGNTVAFGTPSKESDIDLFIVVKDGRLWITRLLATVVIHCFGLRRHGAHIQDRLCLSFYITDHSLDLSKIALPDGDDVYLSFWIATLVPLFDPYNMDTRIRRESAPLLQNLPNGTSHFFTASRWRVQDHYTARIFRRSLEYLFSGRLGTWFEQYVRAAQKKRIEAKKSSQSGGVHISDTMLKFHETDRRLLYREQWKEYCRAL